MKNFLFVVSAIALGATAHADGDQIPIKCSQGTLNCTQVGEHSHSFGDRGGQEPPVRDPYQGQSGGGSSNIEPPIRDPYEAETPGNVEEPVVRDPNQDVKPVPQVKYDHEETDTDRLKREAKEAEEQRKRLEAARRQAENRNLDEAARRAASQEALRAQGRFRLELNRGLANVKKASIQSTDKLRSELKVLQTWHKEMVAAGLTKELATWYAENQTAIQELVAAKEELQWLAANRAVLQGLVSDYESLGELYPNAKGAYFRALGDEVKATKTLAEEAKATAAGAQGSANTALIAAIIAGVIALAGAIKAFLFK